MLPHGPRTSLGINERGPDRRAGTRRPSDAGDLSRSRLAQAGRHVKSGGLGLGGGVRGAAPVWTRVSYFQHLQIFTVPKRLAFFKWCRLKHQMVKVFGYYLHPFVKARKMGSIKRSGGRGERGIINYSVCETS